MHIKELDTLRSKVPALQENAGLVRVALSIILVFGITDLFFLAADREFAEWMPDGEIVVLAIGFLLLSRFYSRRDANVRKHGSGAYSIAFTRLGIPGVGIVLASIAHLAFIAGPGIPPLWWKPWLVALGWLLLIISAALWWRAIGTLGIDNASMLYVYDPEHSQIVSGALYSVVRHPIHAAALDLSFGLALIHANWYALLVALLMPLFFAGWIRLVEEPELIKRLPAYAEYRRTVPAFWPRPSQAFAFLRYLIAFDG